MAADSDTIATTVKEVLADPRLQTAWPVPEPEPEVEPLQFPEWSREAFATIGAYAEVIFWIAVIGLAIFLAIRLVPLLRDMWKRRRSIAARPAVETATEIRPAAPAINDRLAAEAEALARQGRFIEAIHTLLLAAVEHLRRTGGTLPPAWTGRELLRRAAMPTASREALGALLGTAERTHFGGRPADAGDWRACRAHFESFVSGGVR